MMDYQPIRGESDNPDRFILRKTEMSRKTNRGNVRVKYLVEEHNISV